VTEDEAKTKWCPFARVGSGASGLGSLNRDAHPDSMFGRNQLPQLSMCIASACMAWRWRAGGTGDEVEERRKPPGEGHGYCGLAGAPQ
jgi:hypothetical protein